MLRISTGHYFLSSGTDSQVKKKYSNNLPGFMHIIYIIHMQMHRGDFTQKQKNQPTKPTHSQKLFQSIWPYPTIQQNIK